MGGDGLKTGWGPLCVLGLGLLATGLLSFQVHRIQVTKDEERFRYETQRICDGIATRLETYVGMIRATAGLFSGSDEVNRDEFHHFVARLNIEQSYPGIQGIGYSERFSAADLTKVQVRLQREGAAGFHVWPTDPRPEYHSILYLEPANRRNQAAIGYDMHTEPVRAEAMDKAAATGLPIASGRVQLVQEIDERKQPGFLIYVPIYARAEIPEQEADRRAMLRGFAYAPFRTNDLLDGIFGSVKNLQADFRLYDAAVSTATLLYDSGNFRSERFQRQQPIVVAGRSWIAAFCSNDRFRAASAADPTWWLFTGGVLISFLMYQLTRQQARGRALAEFQAGVIQASATSLRASDRQLRALNETLEQRVAERTALAEERANQLQQLATELTHAEQSERRRLAQVLHDHLQQYLYAIKLRLMQVVKAVSDQPETQDRLHQLDSMLTEMLKLTRSLTVELHPPVLADRGLGAGLAWLARQMLSDHELRVELEVKDDLQIESEDLSAFLLQAIREILFNVVKHARVTEARIEMWREGDQVVIAVSDRGLGFDAGQFNAGQKFMGTGLSSFRQRLALLGGELEAQSQLGQGTTITLRAPLRAVEAGSAESGAEALRRPAEHRERMLLPEHPRKRVMLVDDHAIVREGLANLLREEPDLELVGEAADGVQAMEMAQQLRPDLIIMDISMPRLNGIEATRRIKLAQPRVRIIGLSMHEQADMALAMSEAGAEGYLSKDAPSSNLLQTIRDVMERRN